MYTRTYEHIRAHRVNLEALRTRIFERGGHQHGGDATAFEAGVHAGVRHLHHAPGEPVVRHAEVAFDRALEALLSSVVGDGWNG